MAPREIIEWCTSRGVSVALGEPGKVRVSPVELVTDEIRAVVLANRGALLLHLTPPEIRHAQTDRRACNDCTQLVRGLCRAAARGELPHAARRYEPIPDRPHRCLGYRPGPEDADRRTGLERYPGMARRAASTLTEMP